MSSPLQLAAGGALLIAVGAFINARITTRMRAGRLLAGVQPHTPTEALASTDHAYVAIVGNVDAAEAFDDENHRPLVYRRERVLIAEDVVTENRPLELACPEPIKVCTPLMLS